jgi:hypothetical protein
MAGEQAAPLPGHAVTPSRSRWPTDHHYRTRANTRSVGHLEPKEPTRATRTSADPPSGRLAGLPADDPVLGDRLGRGHRAAQPAAITQGHPPSRPIVGNDGGRRWGRQPSGERAGWRRSRWRLRQGADLVQRLGRGPLADRLRQWLADGHGRSAGLAASAAATPPGHTAAQSPRVRALGAPGAILGAEGWFTEWHEGQPASVGTRQPLRRPAAGQPHSARPHSL